MEQILLSLTEDEVLHLLKHKALSERRSIDCDFCSNEKEIEIRIEIEEP